MTREEFENAVREIQENLVPVTEKVVGLGYDKIELTCSEERLATATDVRVDFGGHPSQWIDLLLRFLNLKRLLLNDCYCQPDHGSGWEGLSKLQSLENLKIRYCVNLSTDAMKEISELSNLRVLTIIADSWRKDKDLDFSALGNLKNLRYLELQADVWVDDLAFVQNLPNLEVLVVDDNEHLDLSHFEVPKSVKFIEVPSYAVKELRERVGKRCHVVAGYKRYGKDKYRFMRPEEREAQEGSDQREAKRRAALKRRIANVKSEMGKLMSEPLIPELGKARIAEMNGHLSELEKSLEGQTAPKPIGSPTSI